MAFWGKYGLRKFEQFRFSPSNAEDSTLSQAITRRIQTTIVLLEVR